jgi:hypothetical protein
VATVSRCFVPFKVPKVRVTLVDSCGTPVVSSCSTIATDGIITVEQTGTYEDREEFFVKNANGVFCVQETNPPILKWIQLTLTFCNVDPELVTFLTGQALVLDDADTPVAIGNDWAGNDASTVNFAFETWTGIANQENCATPLYGYALWPWMVEGTMGDVTYNNGNANFQVVARTKVGNNWGQGPYTVQQSAATATLHNPIPLTPAIASTAHRRMITTNEPPPLGGCGCIALPNPALVFSDTGVLTGTVTIPTTPYTTSVLPGTIDWGDSTTTTVTTGPTADHVYAMAGTYTVTFRSKAFSTAPWTSAATPIA